MQHRASVAVRFAAAPAALAALLVGGCAHAPRAARSATRSLRPAEAAGPGTQAAGVWDWTFSSVDEQQSDERVEHEEWHLEQTGHDVKGYYDRTVTVRSTDERLFRCNQKANFTRFTRVRVAGVLEGERLVLRELAFVTKPSPCDDGARNLVAYVGVVRGGTMRLQWGPDAGQTLHRRDGVAAGDVVRTALELPADAATARVAGHAAVAGTWEWELKSIDAEGDERIEREQWHLTEGDDGIGGWYERRVLRVRGDGTFSCNSKDRFETITRYDIRGDRMGERVMLREVGYHADRSACDNGQRRLDSYNGTVSDDGGELVLSWGPGNQLLRRAGR